MKARALSAMVVFAFALWASHTPADADAAPPRPTCDFKIVLAELAAVGSSHRYAEYAVFLEPAPHLQGTYTVDLSAGMDDGATTHLDVDGFEIGSPHGGGAYPVTLIVMPNPGVRWFSVDGDASAAGTQTCSDTSYTMDSATFSTSTSFDDASSWVTLEKPVLLPVSEADFLTRIFPDYPYMAREEDAQGYVVVRILVGPDGSVEETSIDESSGNVLLDDASLAAARTSTFKPAHLPAAYGGGAIGAEYLLVYTFSLNQ